MEMDLLRDSIVCCSYCKEEPQIQETGSAAMNEYFIECDCGCRGPKGLERDAIEGWNEIMDC